MSTKNGLSDVTGFPVGLLLVILIALVVLLIVGAFLWRSFFANPTDFRSQVYDSTNKPSSVEKEAQPESNVEVVQSLKPQTVSAADTINNNSDDDVVELARKPNSSDQTVENAGDISISMDDEQKD